VDYSESLAAEAAPARAGARRGIRAARWLAWSLWALATAQAALGLLLAALNHLTLRSLFAEHVVASVSAALALTTVGALVATRRPGNMIGWLLCAAGVIGGLGAWTGQYAALTACVVALYMLVVGYLGTLLNARGNLLIALVATGLVAVLFQPLRERLQRTVDRLMSGDRADPYTVLARLGQRLEAALAPAAVLPTIVQTVKDALKLPYVAIALDRSSEFNVLSSELTAPETQNSTFKTQNYEIVAASGELPAHPLTRSPARPLTLPLVYQGEPVGRLILGRRAPGEAWSQADRRLLDDLARHAGIAVHAVRLHAHALRLAADLQQSRERLVSAREEERRRLRRDLHDGLGPALAGLTLKLDAAHDEMHEDVDAAAGMLRDLKRDVQEAIADIRRLVYDLRPPALDELGLVAALQLQIAHYQQAELRIALDAPEALPPLPAAVEVAAYRIVAEALTNVVRHAHARRCRVRLAIDGALEIEVLDEGIGLPHVGDVRGLGLMAAVELVAGKATKQPFTPESGVAARLPNELLKRGLFTRTIGETICLAPPLVTTAEQIDRIVEIVGESVAAL